MHQRYIDLTLYNIWANNCLIKDLLEQDEALINNEIIGSFPTIRATILHIWYAEVGWLSRIKEMGWQVEVVKNFLGSNRDLFTAWLISSQELNKFVIECDLEKEIVFDHKGRQFAIPRREVIQTVCNHGSYHRGQVVMMLRQLGVTSITQTDYIEWVRQNILNKTAH